MRIDGTYGAGAQKPAEEHAETRRAEPTRPGQVDSADAVIIRSQQELIASAGATPEVRADAVRAARELLDSGELDTPDAARRAAETLLDRGV